MIAAFAWSDVAKNARLRWFPAHGADDSDSRSQIAEAMMQSGTALCVGSFDGPHIGHKALFRTVTQAASRLGLVPGVITFKRPLAGLKGMNGKDNKTCYTGDISTLQERLQCFEEYGMKFAVVVDFSSDFAKISGDVFFSMLQTRLNCRFVAEGEDFHCGCGGAFGKQEIENFCVGHGMMCAFVPPVMVNGERVSSSRVREALARGDAALAQAMLEGEGHIL